MERKATEMNTAKEVFRCGCGAGRDRLWFMRDGFSLDLNGQEPLWVSGSCGWWLADAEVGAAAAVDPEATTIDTPGVVADAG